MFINNISAIVFRNGEFLVITKEKVPQINFKLKKNISPRYGYSNKYRRGIYTFDYKYISAFYPFENEKNTFLVIELGGREAYLIKCKSKTLRNYYFNKLSKYIQDWGETNNDKF